MIECLRRDNICYNNDIESNSYEYILSYKDVRRVRRSSSIIFELMQLINSSIYTFNYLLFAVCRKTCALTVR